jgi:hypothetical protein
VGTHYYLREFFPALEFNPDPNTRHIGESSVGWCFSLHVFPGEGIHNLDDWIVMFESPTSSIEDEYGTELSAAKMLEVIRERSWNGDAVAGAYDVAKGRVSLGPNGLMRSAIDGRYCIGHGAGTWDLRAGDFP